MKPKVLGKGLGNLIGSSGRSSESSDTSTNSPMREIKLSEIKVNPNQPRKTFSAESISELAETIKQHGLIQPIVVTKTNDGYELVSGERRYRACKEAGFHKIPAIVRNYSEKETLEIAIIENIQREDLNPIEEALAYQQLTEKLSMKITEVAARVGKNRSTVSNMIRLLQLPDSVKELIKTRKLSEGHARPLLSIGDKKKLETYAQQIVDKNLTVRDVEEYVASLWETKTTLSTKRDNTDPTIMNVETKIRNKLSAKVKISHNAKVGKGKIVISYNSIDEMDRILSNMNIRQ
ncbi:MAG TPA: ParB/RepB/Spo0J family partition protein [Leptospiraceae bacterium]|nr:ParB/RepB/Spo0J family partition protein [Leptospiraceae bacterium]HMY30753.1 ParB/RepB/Spo0J family partition protein [Leptospiraceae bacterium]HMZ64331.1 ParB/RepB/Spo0J family partition protein [Leptospiraceae bacterium]HNA08606.1 ParB/RepB/Spo0J family partition protein [Leptospiraceae bacterium]HNB96670.1 ParB/RepB/Spo0J family partition protein [Leptospiraceae bacterium]